MSKNMKLIFQLFELNLDEKNIIELVTGIKMNSSFI